MNNLFHKMFELKGELRWVLIGHAAAFLGSIFGVKLLTGMLGTDGYGELALGLTFSGFLTTFLHNPLANAAARFYAPYRDSGRGLVYFAVFRQLHLQIFFLLLPFVICSATVVYFTKGGTWAMLLLCGLLFGMVSGIGATFLAWQNAARDRRSATVAQIADIWLRVGVAITAVALLGTGQAALGGYLIGAVLVVIWQNRRARQQESVFEKNEPTPAPSQLSQARSDFFTFIVPFVGFSLFTMAALYADRWIIQISSGASAVGIYAALFQIASSPVNLLFAVLNQLMVPIIYEHAGTMNSAEQTVNTRRMIRKTVLLALVLSIVGAMLTAVVAHPLALLLTAKEFSRHYGILWQLVLGLALWQVGQLMALEGICANKPEIYLWPKGVHAVTLVLLGYLLSSKYGGVAGMALAIIVSAIFYLVAVALVNLRLRLSLRSC